MNGREFFIARWKQEFPVLYGPSGDEGMAP